MNPIESTDPDVEENEGSPNAPGDQNLVSLERVGWLVLALWFLLPGLVGISGSVLRYLHGDFGQAMTPILTLGFVLVQSLAGVLVLAGWRFLPLTLLVLEIISVLAASFLLGSTSATGGVGVVLGQGLFSVAGAAAILGYRYKVKAPVRQVLSVALLTAFALNLPILATRVGAAFGHVLAPRSVSYVAEVGQRLSGLRFVDLSGSAVELSDPGTIYVLNFWATWCVPCREELPLLIAMFKTLPAEAPVRLMAVNTEGLERETIEAFLEKEGLQGLDVYSDPTGAQDLLGTGTIPLTVVIKDRTLMTRHVGYGPDTVPSLKAEIQRYLRDVGPEESARPPS